MDQPTCSRTGCKALAHSRGLCRTHYNRARIAGALPLVRTGSVSLNDLAEIDLEWRVDGKCNGVDPDLFFPKRGESTSEAKKVCASCPVKSECLEFALATSEKYGIWGGKSERERRQIRKQRNEQRLTAA